MVGTSTGTRAVSPQLLRKCANCSFVRGTSTRQPNNGFVSDHEFVAVAQYLTDDEFQVLPAAAFTAAGSSSNVLAIVRCSAVVAPRVIVISVGLAASGNKALEMSTALSAPLGMITVNQGTGNSAPVGHRIGFQ